LNKREATYENAVRPVLQQGLKMRKQALAHLWTLSDKPYGTQARLFSEVAVGVAHHLLYFAGQITRDVGRRDVAQRCKSEAGNILKIRNVTHGRNKAEEGNTWFVFSKSDLSELVMSIST
jgi:hypothetical protein